MNRYGIVHTRYEHGLLCQSWVRALNNGDAIHYPTVEGADEHATEINNEVGHNRHHVRLMESKR